MNSKNDPSDVSAADPRDESASSNDEEFEELLESLPRRKYFDGRTLCQYQGKYWIPLRIFHGVFFCRKNFRARETDIILATMPKAGTTWLKALVFSIVTRHTYKSALDESPLLTSNSHELVPFLEFDIYREHGNPDLGNMTFPSPRIFSTHVSHGVLPNSIRESGCRVIYLCRNPLDQFVSHRHFLISNRLEPEEEPLPLDEAFELYCNGIQRFGPYWDQMLEYWNASLTEPKRVLFLKYEEVMEDTVSSLKKMAEFVGMPFSDEEEGQGRIEEISKLCSFENLKNLDVNKEGIRHGVLPNSSYFRKGEVGDWKNHLTLEMAQRLENIFNEKLCGSGLTFKSCTSN